MPISKTECRDCMEAMREFPDGFFDLAVVDPPYGDAAADTHTHTHGTASANASTGTSRSPAQLLPSPRERERERRAARHGQGRNVRQPDGTWGLANWRRLGEETGSDKKIIAWDVAPGQEYFDELFRVSRNQIIWGGNYFRLPPTRCFLVWRKLTISETFSMAMAEYAWTSFDGNAKVFECPPQGKPGDRFHPTQKPTELYRWILALYAKPGYKILDTHLGSGSSRIAAWDAGLDFWGYEIDEDYFRLEEERFERHAAQMSLFLDDTQEAMSFDT